jgi:adenylate kinase
VYLVVSVLPQERLDMKHICVGDIIKENKIWEGRDEELDTHILDEDKLFDVLDPLIDEAADEGHGVVIDFHVCEIFPERWFDLVLVLRANTEILYDRLTARGYSDRKRSENLECEIMQIILDEARESYNVNIVQEISSNTLDDMESTVQRVQDWSKQWAIDRGYADS